MRIGYFWPVYPNGFCSTGLANGSRLVESTLDLVDLVDSGGRGDLPRVAKTPSPLGICRRLWLLGCFSPRVVGLQRPPVDSARSSRCRFHIVDWSMGGIQWACLAALPILALYNGTRGTWRLKYLFYIYYPAHLVVLEGLAMLI